MTKQTKREICLPFGGFYESIWSDIVDRAAENTAEWDCDGQRASSGDHRYVADERLRLDQGVYQDAMFDACDYSAGYAALARDYVELFAGKLREETGLNIALKLCHISSPREYNFQTDRLFSEISDADAQKLFDYSAALDNHETLARLIHKRHTSRSGFISFYKNTLESWLEKPVSEWDHNELGTLLMVAVELFDSEWEMDIAHSLCEHDHEYLDAAVDWKKYEAAIEAAREALRAEILADDPDHVPPVPRCPYTRDMFAPPSA